MDHLESCQSSPVSNEQGSMVHQAEEAAEEKDPRHLWCFESAQLISMVLLPWVWTDFVKMVLCRIALERWFSCAAQDTIFGFLHSCFFCNTMHCMCKLQALYLSIILWEMSRREGRSWHSSAVVTPSIYGTIMVWIKSLKSFTLLTIFRSKSAGLETGKT